VGRRVALLTVALLALLTASAGAKRLVGTPHADVLRGTAGSDVLDGRGGADLLDGRGGRDRLLGAAGADRLEAFDGVRDRLDCGDGADLAVADGSDRVASDCEVVSRQVSRDALVGGPGQHATEVEPHAGAHGSTVVAVFQVGRIEDGGAMAIGWATSRDGGRAWRSGLLPGLTTSSRGQRLRVGAAGTSQAAAWHAAGTRSGDGASLAPPFTRASDPVVAYDAQHGVWLATTLALSAEKSALAVSRSVDGLSWTSPVIADSTTGPLAYDKEWIACDSWPASRFRGRCYLGYSDLVGDRIATRVSTDGGASWSVPVSPPGNAGQAAIEGRYAPGVQPVVSPDGDVVIVYYDEGRLAAVRSTDGGATYSLPAAIGPASFAESPALRAAPLPTAAVDAAGTVYAAWADCRARPGCRANDIVLSRSSDGVSWTAPERVAIGSGGDRLFPALAADEATPGHIALTYYVRIGGRLGVRLATSADGGSRWSRPVRLDAEPARFSWLADAGGAMVGDYVATALSSGRSVAVFSLAAAPAGRLNQGIFAAAVPLAGDEELVSK